MKEDSNVEQGPKPETPAEKPGTPKAVDEKSEETDDKDKDPEIEAGKDSKNSVASV